MELPQQVLCERCGANSGVITTGVDEKELAGAMTADDRRWDEGFFYAIECPNCGTRMQCLSPPP